MKRVKIRQCPVCATIRAYSASLAADLKAEQDVEVQVVDGDKDELSILIDDELVACKSDALATTAFVLNAVRESASVMDKS